MHLARLEYELEQRKKLAELCSTFEDEKKQLATGTLFIMFTVWCEKKTSLSYIEK